jgi:predicted AlkP superfamily pyrophosphatase or phosphodiesterase
MKSRPILLITLVWAVVIASYGAESANSKSNVVVLISLGGFPASELRDEKVLAPTLRRLASEGAVASRMTAIDPAISWPNHAALATGVGANKHGVLYNGILVRGGPRTPVQVKPCSRAEILRAPTFYDLAHEAGQTTAQVGWPPCETGETINWSFGELADSKSLIAHEMIQAGALKDSDLDQVPVTTSARRDEMWSRAVTHVITQHRPQVLLVRLTDFDAVTHKYGPGTPESRAAISAADARINQILEVLKRMSLLERATILVVSDQGFKPARRNIRPNAALRKAGLLTIVGPKVLPKVVGADAYALTAGGIAQLFLTNPDRREETRARIKEIFAGMEGVERVVEPPAYAKSGFPDANQSDQMGDFVLLAKPGYGFIAAPDGEPVTDVVEGTTVAFHGFPSSDPDMDGIFIAWGRHVRAGIHLDKVSNVDVAPTIAQILGLKMENVDGKILRDILQ